VNSSDLLLPDLSSHEYFLQEFMYTHEETSNIRRQNHLRVGTKLDDKDPRVGRDPSSPYRLRAGDLVAFGPYENGFMVAEVIDPYVEYSIAENIINFTIILKDNKLSAKRPVQYGANLVRKLILHPASAGLPAGPCDRATGGRGKR
jgi:hypothetical protein